MDTNKIEINKNRLAELLRKEQELRLLENGGVDDWEWYGESLYPDDGVTYLDIQYMSDDAVIDMYL